MSDICNIRTMTVPAAISRPKHMEAQGFVSKNLRLEKVQRKSSRAAIRQDGNMVWIARPCDALPSLIRHFLAPRGGLYRPLNAVCAVLLPGFEPRRR
jgi:hypothetical protein